MCVVVKEPPNSLEVNSKKCRNRREGLVGLTGLEPVTLRLSSACSNQLSYRPGAGFRPRPSGLPARNGGAEETRTPDLLLAKQTLYQLSYSPKSLGGTDNDPAERGPRRAPEFALNAAL